MYGKLKYGDALVCETLSIWGMRGYTEMRGYGLDFGMGKR